MPSYFVVQPNGLLARFSTVVDDFTAMNMTESEAAETVSNETLERAKHEAEQGITRAKELSLTRWPDCLSTIRAIHGDATVAERVHFLDAEPVPANPPSSGASDAPTCKCDIEIRWSKVATGTVHVLMCPLHTFAPDLYTALEELLKAGAHEGPCDNCDPETGEPYDEAGACEAHLNACEARRKIARTALAKARGKKP